MQITIHNPNDLKLIDYRKVLPLQGDLKDLTEKNAERLKNVFERRGFRQPLNLWKKGEEMYLLDGHQRIRVMKEFDMNDNGNYEVPYFVTEAKDEKEAKMQILEISSQYGTITQEGFDEFAVELPEAELPDVYFDNLYHDKSDPEVVEDEAPPVADVAISKLGEVYQLGRHRVMCGDSTDKANVELLMAGEKADMVFTDPPYGMDLDTDYSTITSGEGKSKKHSKVIGDDEPYDPKPLFDMFGDCEEIMLFGADYYLPRIPDWSNGTWLIWDKRETENYDKVIGSSFEVLWSKKKRRKEILRYEFVSWGRRMEDGEKTHPTMKPVKLLGRILGMTQSKTIADPYGGSGSTLIACEQLDRACFMMELDPKYCDVIRKRYWKFVNEGNEEGWEVNTPPVDKVS